MRVPSPSTKRGYGWVNRARADLRRLQLSPSLPHQAYEPAAAHGLAPGGLRVELWYARDVHEGLAIHPI